MLAQMENKMMAFRIAADPRLEREREDGLRKKMPPEYYKRMLNSSFDTVLKKAKAQTGLCYAELPRELFHGDQFDLRKWTVLVDDACLRKIARYNDVNLERQTQFVPRNIVQSGDVNAVELLASMTRASVEGETMFTGIKTLLIPNAMKITDAGVLALASSVTSLRKIDFSGCKNLSDVALRALMKRADMLQELDLSDCPNVQGAGLVAVGECCHRLRVLRLRRCPASEEWLIKRLAAGCPELRVVDLTMSVKVSDECVKSLANRCRKLVELRLGFCKLVSDVGILAISESCRGLEVLDLQRIEMPHKVTDVGLLSLAQRCECLSELNLSGNNFITDVGISWLASGCRALRKLDISKCVKIGDIGLRSLSEGCVDLECLNLEDLKLVSDVGIRLIATGCRKLKEINLANVFLLTDGAQRDFGNEGLQVLCTICTDLEKLNIRGCFQVGGRIMRTLATGVDPLSETAKLGLGRPLRTLIASGLPKLNAKALRPLLEGRAGGILSTLKISNCEGIDDKAMAIIGKTCLKLTNLDVSHCENITSRGVAAFVRGGRCKGLLHLNLSFCVGVKDLALLALADAGFEPGLQTLNLKGCPDITEIGVAWLSEKCSSLMEMNLKGCEAISFSGIKAMLGNWRYVRLRNDKDFFGIYPCVQCREMRFMDEYGSVWKSAILIQNTYRAKVARGVMHRKREQNLMEWTARKLQSFWRGRVARRYVIMKRMQRDRELEACIKIQSIFRSRKARARAEQKRERARQLKCEKCAIYVQKVWRGKMCRNMLEVARQKRRQYLERCASAATKVQRIWRGRQGRKHYSLAQAAMLARREKEHNSAARLQGLFRGRRARIEARKRRDAELRYEREKEKAALTVQKAVRCRQAWKEAEKLRNQAANTERAAIKLQCLWRCKNGKLAVHLRRQAHASAKLERSAIRIQCLWRRRKGQASMHLLKMARLQQQQARNHAVMKLQRIIRGRRARLHALVLKLERDKQLGRRAKLEEWAATKVQSHFRGKLGRQRARMQREAKMRRWKEMYDKEQDRPFYYNQDTGEVRYRKPQALLALLPRPICSNCEFKEAYVECGSCVELYCEDCWNAVHFGGKRAEHVFRAIYDKYGKRIDYGDGEWPSIWPTEIEQDELVGWQQIARQEQIQRGERPTAGIPQHVLDFEDQEQQDLDKLAMDKLALIKQLEKEEQEQDQQGKLEGETPWERFWNDEYNCFYYYNHDTGQSTYEVPGEYVDSYEIVSSDEKQVQNEAEWTKQFDQNTGRAFFHNLRTGISVFERPAEYETPRSQRSEDYDDDVNPIWTRHLESDEDVKESGELPRFYYYNHLTGTSQYERPPEYKTPRKREWVKYFDEYEQREYYSNGKDIQWMRPEDYETPRIEGLERGENGWVKYPDPETKAMIYENTKTSVITYDRPFDFVTIVHDQPKSEVPWERFYDHATGYCYYYNDETGETTYDLPFGYMDPPEIVDPDSGESVFVPEDGICNRLRPIEDGLDGLEAKQHLLSMDETWKQNEDWTLEGIRTWVETFLNDHTETVQIETPQLRPEQRKLVVQVCEELHLECNIHGFGLMRSVIISRQEEGDGDM